MNQYQIEAIPQLPTEIKEAIANERFAVFIGAGVSRLVGCQGWDQLAKNLVERCARTQKVDGEPIINFKEKESLISQNDHKKIITVCSVLLQESDYERVFFDEMEKSLQSVPELIAKHNIYEEIIRLHALFLTTNADIHFDSKFTTNRNLFRLEDFDKDTIDRNKLYHIHGSISEPSSLIFRTDEYIKRYQTDAFQDFLKRIFNSYTILFVGYGLSEFELLDYLVTGVGGNALNTEKHFLLQGYYQGESNLVRFDQCYYGKLGIKRILPYEKDKKGYIQIFDIVKSWADQINSSTPYLFDSFSIIDDAIENYDKEKESKVLQIIKNDIPQENYFFQKLSTAINPLPWFISLRELGYFSPFKDTLAQQTKEHKGYIIPSRNILSYLDNTSKKAAEINDVTSIEQIVEIADSIIKERINCINTLDDYRISWLVLKIIFNLPASNIKQQHFDYIRFTLRSPGSNDLVSAGIEEQYLPRLLNSGSPQQVLSLLEIMLEYQKEDEGAYAEYTSIVQSYWLQQCLEKYRKAIGQKCGIAAAQIAIENVKSIIREDPSQFNEIWIVTIEDNEQNQFPDRFEYQIVVLIRDILAQAAPNEVDKIVEKLLSEEHPIFKRIALNQIDIHYDKLGHYFWEATANPFDIENVKHETYELLKNHCTKFSDEEINKIIGWVETENRFIPETLVNEKEKIAKLEAYQKKEWLSSILGSNKPEVTELFNTYDKINSEKVDHPGFVYWSGGEWEGDEVINSSELQSKSTDEIVLFLNSYQPREHDHISEENLKGLIKRLVFDSPQIFSLQLDPFLKVARKYQHSILWGFYEAWKNGKEIDWKEVLTFAHNIISKEDFWKESYESVYHYRNWILSIIADLIQEGTRKDEHAFPEALFKLTEEILLLMANRCEASTPVLKDIINSVLNSTKGKIFSAIVLFSLRKARLHKDDPERWSRRIKEDFNERLNPNFESSLDFPVIVAQYLPYLIYLDEQWTISNIEKIFPTDNEERWQAAMSSYLFHAIPLRKNIYKLLRDKGYYSRAIKTNFEDKHSLDRLIEHICIVYIEGEESLSDVGSMINQVLSHKNHNHISAIIRTFYRWRDQINSSLHPKVIQLWHKLIDLLKAEPKNENTIKNSAALFQLSYYIDEIDEEINGLIEYSLSDLKEKDNFNLYNLLENLSRLVLVNSRYVASIYLKMIDGKIFPTYKKEHIENIIIGLYNNSENDAADRICITYGLQNIDFLRPIYEKYHAKEIKDIQ